MRRLDFPSLISIFVFYLSSFLALLAGNATSNYGLIVLTQEITGSHKLSGIVFFINYATPILITLFAGVLLDQFSIRAAIFYSYLLYGASAFFLTLFVNRLTDSTFSILLMSTSALLNGLALSIAQPARFALLGALVPERSIKKATAGLNILIIFGFTFSPLLVSFLLKKGKWSTVFTVIAILFAVAAGLLAFVTSSKPQKYVGLEKKKQSAIRVLLEGVDFARRTPFILNLLLLTIPSLIILGTIQILVPAIGREILSLDKEGQAALLTSFGIGLIVGGIGSIGLLNWRYVRSFIALSLPILCCLFLASIFTFKHGSSLLSQVLIGVGLIIGAHGNLVPSLLQASTPDRFRGRVMSMYSLSFNAFPALAAILVGYLSDGFGPSASIAIVGCGTLLGVFVLLQKIGITSDTKT